MQLAKCPRVLYMYVKLSNKMYVYCSKALRDHVFLNLIPHHSLQKERIRKISQEQRQALGGKPSPTARGNNNDDDDDDDDDDHGVYETLWDAISPPVPQRTVSIKGKDVRRIEQPLYHIEDFNLLKVLGKGSFGKVKRDVNWNAFEAISSESHKIVVIGVEDM